MAIVIDSSIFIAAEKKLLDLDPFLDQHAEEGFAMSAITASELLHGVHRAPPEHRVRRDAFVEQLLTHIPILPFDFLVARTHARLWADLAAQGQLVGAHDLLIAATALAADYAVATRDERSFRKIPGLKLIIP